MFFLAALTILGSFALYSWYHLHTGLLRGHFILSILAVLAMFGITFLPLLSRATRQTWPCGPWIETFTWIWIAWLFWFSCTMFLLDCWNGGEYTVYRLRQACLPANSPPPEIRRLNLSPRAQLRTGLAVLVLLTAWGSLEAGAIRAKKVTVHDQELPAELDGYRILLISDLHINPQIQPRILTRTARILQENPADLLVSTGDFLDGAITPQLGILIRQLIPHENFPDGCYGVLGNHDAYSGAAPSAEAHKMAGLTLLGVIDKSSDDEHPLCGVTVGDKLWLGGVPDAAIARRQGQNTWQEDNGVMPVPPDRYGIMLKHQPQVTRKIADSGYRLMLSGHTHGGQILPFGLFVRLHYPVPTGRLSRSQGIIQYVTPGTGYWGMPFRVLSRPEVTILTLQKN